MHGRIANNGCANKGLNVLIIAKFLDFFARARKEANLLAFTGHLTLFGDIIESEGREVEYCLMPFRSSFKRR